MTDAAAITAAADEISGVPISARHKLQIQTSARTSPSRPSVMFTALENPDKATTVSAGRSKAGVSIHPQSAKRTRSATSTGSSRNAMTENMPKSKRRPPAEMLC